MDISAEHLVPVLVVAAVAVALCAAARARPGAWLTPAAVALGALVLLVEAAWVGWLVWRGAWTPASGLPLQLCDAATVLAAAALWTRRRPLVELLYFWACAGTVQALLTPDSPGGFPSLLYFQYYAAHGAIVVAAVFLVVGLRIVPTRGAVLRAAALTAAYAAAVGLVDLATGADYLYLRRPPAAHTMFDLLGPWPWYLAAATAVGLGLFTLLDLPFRAGRRAS
jgi:hypothetical integral membrane protein (TIGR02206 family)